MTLLITIIVGAVSFIFGYHFCKIHHKELIENYKYAKALADEAMTSFKKMTDEYELPRK